FIKGAQADVAAARQALNELRSGACFVKGTPLLTPAGARPVEQFRPGDAILSQPEHEPDGRVETKVVEEVFIRVAPVVRLMVNGHEILTTAEHPFFVRERGWIAASLLETGDLLQSHEGARIRVEGVEKTREIATVYNLRVADYHTYFVGCDEW